MPARRKPRSAIRRRTEAVAERPRADEEAAARAVSARVRQIAFGLLLLGAMLGPFAPTIENNFVLRLIVQMLFMLTGALWIMSMALEGQVRLRRTGMAPWLLLVAGAIVSGVVNASYRYPAALAAFTWFSSMAAFLFVAHEVRTRRARVLLLGAILASAFCVALHGLHQLFVELPDAREAFSRDPRAILRDLRLPENAAYNLEGRIGKDRVFSTFLIPNSLAAFIVLVLPAGIGLLLDRLKTWLRSDSPAPWIWRVALLLPMLAALYFTESKAGWLAFAAALAALGVWGFGALLWRQRMNVVAALASVVIILIISQYSGLFPPVRDYISSSRARVAYWRGAALIFEKHPFVGVGLDNFSEHYARVKEPEDEEARRAHNDYLQLLAETGMIGLFAYLAFLIRFWHRVWRPAGELVPPDDPEPAFDSTARKAICILAAAAFLIEALCGGTFRSEPGLMGWTWPLTLCLGWIGFFLVFVGRPNTAGLARVSFTTIGIGSGLIGFFMHSLADFNHYVGGLFQTAWILMALLLCARMSGQPKDYAVDRKLGPGRRLALTVGSAAAMLALMYGFVLRVAEAHTLRERAIDASLPLSLEARELGMQAAIKSNPRDAHLHALRSDVLLAMWMSGQRTTARGLTTVTEALMSAQEASRLNPARAEYSTRLGRLYELRWRDEKNITDHQDAFDAFQRAEELFPSNPDIALALARLYDQVRRHDVALGKYIRARRLHDEQIASREFKPAELQELDRRIGELKIANTRHVAPPPPRFTQPRLLGIPGMAGR